MGKYAQTRKRFLLSKWLRLACLLILLAGCVEERGEMLVTGGGGGRLDVRLFCGEALSESLLEDAEKTGKSLVELTRQRVGGGWRGIAFWSDEVGEEREDGRVFYRGSAWFRDVNELDFSGKRCSWNAESEGGGTFDFYYDPLPELDEGESRSAQWEKTEEAWKGFDVMLAIRLPGKVERVSGAGKAEGREVRFRLTEAGLREGAQLDEKTRRMRYHELRATVGEAVPEAAVEEEAFEKAWEAVETLAVPHGEVETPRPLSGPVPRPSPLEPPLTIEEFKRFYAVPHSDPDWRLTKVESDDPGGVETWSGSIRGAREERIPILIGIPREGRPCPVSVKQHTWHGTKEIGQKTGQPVLEEGVAVVSFDGPLVGERKIEGRDPLGETPEQKVDNRRWAVQDLRCVLRALPSAPLPGGLVDLKAGMIVVGVSLGGPTAAMAFALEEEHAAAGATVVAGAGAYSGARDGEPLGGLLEGAGDMRLRATPEAQREAALLDPAMALPLVRPRPLAIIGGEDDAYAPGSSLRRLARAAHAWPRVTLRVHPDVGHFLTEKQKQEVVDWIVETANTLRR